MIVLTLSMFLGLVVKYSNKVKAFFSLKPIWYKLIHNFVGLIGYALGIISLCYAYFTDWFILHNAETSRLTALALTITAALWSINKAIVSLCSQIKGVIP